MVELDLPLNRVPGRPVVCALFRGFVHHGFQHSDGQGCFLVFIQEADDLHQRPRNATRKHKECHKRTNRKLAAQNQGCSKSHYADLHCFFQPSGRSTCHGGHGANIPLTAKRCSKARIPIPTPRPFQNQRFDCAHVVQSFHQERLPISFGSIKRIKPNAKSGQKKGYYCGNCDCEAGNNGSQRPRKKGQKGNQ